MLRFLVDMEKFKFFSFGIISGIGLFLIASSFITAFANYQLVNQLERQEQYIEQPASQSAEITIEEATPSATATPTKVYRPLPTVTIVPTISQ